MSPFSPAERGHASKAPMMGANTLHCCENGGHVIMVAGRIDATNEKGGLIQASRVRTVTPGAIAIKQHLEQRLDGRLFFGKTRDRESCRVDLARSVATLPLSIPEGKNHKGKTARKRYGTSCGQASTAS